MFQSLLSKLIGARCVEQLQRDCRRILLKRLQGCHRDANVQEALIAGLVVARAHLPVQVAQVFACRAACLSTYVALIS